jgi:ComF family protein
MTLATASSTRLRLPGQCAVCRDWQDDALCAPCILRFAPNVVRCPGCALRLRAAAAHCGACVRQSSPFGRCIAAVDYAFPWDGLIGAFKFDGQVELAGPLSALLTEAVRAAGDALPDCVMPVPLAPKRLRERGYNQAWELARRAAGALHLAADATRLVRPLDSAHQAALPLTRRHANLRGAFIVPPIRRALPAHVALVDDVMTSGATLSEAAGALRRAGVQRVDAWVLARTPAPGD